ncbi:hypothetical protein Tco_0488566 [Tanacetum coccineum]
MESEKYLEGQSMQRPPLFESDGFIYWKNRFETYVKSKDLDLWHVITDGDFPPIQFNPETKKDEIVSFHKQNDDLKKKLAKNNEAKMVIYNALPRKEYERIFMCQTAKEIWDTLLITHQGNNQVKANKIDLLVQQYEQFMIPEEESIDNAFAKFNTIITSLKALDEGFSSKNCVRKFLRALHPKWRAKVTICDQCRKPALSFMRPFGCPVTILNTLDHLENEDSEVPNTEEPRINQENDANVNSTNNINTVSLTVNAADIENNDVDENIVYGCIDDLNMPNLEEIVYSDDDDEEVGAEADMNNLATTVPSYSKDSQSSCYEEIFRYLKGHPKLGLWYPRDSPFDLEAFSDSDYVGASLDRKSTTGGIIDFLNASSIKYVLTLSPTVYESCIKQFWATAKAKIVNGEPYIQSLVDKKKVIITEKSVRSDLMLEDAEGTKCLPNDVLDLEVEKAKTAQAKEIASLKKRVKQLEKRKKLRTSGLKRLRKVGSAIQVESSNDVSLGAQEDASKHGRKIADLDADAEVTLIDETQERNDEDLMFDTDVLNGDEVFEEPIVNAAKTTSSTPVSAADPVTTAGEVVTTASATTTVDELTLAQTLIEIKAAKPKAVTTVATTITTAAASTRPKAKGTIFHDQEDQAPAFTPIVSSSQASQLPQAKDKGKAKMVEKPLKKKDQIALDEELALRMYDEEQAELERMQKEIFAQEEASRAAIIEELDSIQAMIEADEQLAARLQAEEEEQFSIEEKSRMLVEMIAE